MRDFRGKCKSKDPRSVTKVLFGAENGAQRFEYRLHELEASSNQDTHVPGYDFTYNGDTHLIHEVTKSLIGNRSIVVALKI